MTSCCGKFLGCPARPELCQRPDAEIALTSRQRDACAASVRAFLMAWASSNTTRHHAIWCRGPTTADFRRFFLTEGRSMPSACSANAGCQRGSLTPCDDPMPGSGKPLHACDACPYQRSTLGNAATVPHGACLCVLRRGTCSAVLWCFPEQGAPIDSHDTRAVVLAHGPPFHQQRLLVSTEPAWTMGTCCRPAVCSSGGHFPAWLVALVALTWRQGVGLPLCHGLLLWLQRCIQSQRGVGGQHAGIASQLLCLLHPILAVVDVHGQCCRPQQDTSTLRLAGSSSAALS